MFIHSDIAFSVIIIYGCYLHFFLNVPTQKWDKIGKTVEKIKKLRLKIHI